MSSLSFLRDATLHRHVFLLALPMVLSNITVPLLGLVDAAVIGHLDDAKYLGGVAVGGTMISVTFWLLGFLRMATTGLSAQALGSNSKSAQALVFVQGCTMALGFAALIIALHQPLLYVVMLLSDASDAVKTQAEIYFSIRVWGAPAALTNLVIMGWLLGQQNAKAPMWLLILTNLANIVFDVAFVMGLDWKVAGAASASVLAEYCSLGLGLWLVSRGWRRQQLPALSSLFAEWRLGLGRFLRLNRDIFLRSLCLQAAFTFMTFQGASLGDEVVAANAVLMSFLMLISFAMDGFAYAIEALVGKAVGERNKAKLWQALWVTTWWSLVISALMAVSFAVGGRWMIGVISSIPEVQQQAVHYLPWLIAMPLVSMWCFLLDGVFIGATRGTDMRNSMFISSIGFFTVWLLFQQTGNHALWAAMLAFMGIRGITLGWVFWKQWRTGTFLSKAI